MRDKRDHLERDRYLSEFHEESVIAVEPPTNWTGGGNVPDPTVDTGELTEDLVQLRSPSGEILDVGWYPFGNADGNFVCVVVVNRDWDHPLRKIVTKDPQVVLRWIQDEIVRLSAPPTKRRREV